MKRITRREFIKIGGMAAAGMSVAGCGLTDFSGLDGWKITGNSDPVDQSNIRDRVRFHGFSNLILLIKVVRFG